MSRRILIVEDDPSTAALLAGGLADAGYDVERVGDGCEGLSRATTGTFDLLIADRMLPGMDGLAMIGAIRAAGIATPTLVLSALATVDNRVDGLKAGADDYLCKPFSFAELSARVEALVRRADRETAPDPKTRLVVGDLEIDLLSRHVVRAGRAITMGAREFTLLEFLARHAGQVVTRAMMLEHVWNYHFDPGSNVVDVHIGRLRRKLEDGFATPLLHTVRGAGYRLSPEELMRLSVTARVALLSIAFALASNLALVGFVWKQTQSDATEGVRRETIAQADALAAVWRNGGERALAQAIRRVGAPGDVALVLAILDQRGGRHEGIAPDRVAVPLRATTFRIARLAPRGLWADRETGYALRPIGDQWLLVGRNLDLIAAEQRAIERALALAVFLSLALGVVGAFVLARYVARRLDAIAGVVDAVGEGDLSRRVEMVAGGHDSFDRLAERLNATLDRTEALMAELRVVTDSLAHDLRSPLSRLRAKTEQAVTLRDERAREQALGGLLVETDLVLRMLTMVMEISRSESVSRDHFTRVAPAALVEEIADLYGPVVEDAGLTFAVVIEHALPPMALHRELLGQALSNLVDNALKHGAGGGSLMIRLARRGDDVAIAVEDRGTGIAPADHATALKRFGRLDRARSTPGAGLGMALIEAVAKLHGGRFELADNAPGLVARIVLPA